MVLGAADPDGRRHECVETLRDQPRGVIAQQGIGGQRQVWAVLLGRSERDHDCVPAALDLGLDLRP